MRNYWLDRRKPIYDTWLPDKNGLFRKVPVIVWKKYYGLYVHSIPCIYYIVTTQELFLITNNTTDADDIVNQLKSKINLKFIYASQKAKHYFITKIKL